MAALVRQRLVKKILDVGELYRSKYLSCWDACSLQQNWVSAADFFFGHICFQGRRDDVSQRVYTGIMTCIRSHFIAASEESFAQSLKDRLEDFAFSLTQHIGKGKVGKKGDQQMAVSALEFMSKLPQWNVVAYSVGRIEAGKTAAHWEELQKIFQVGPKTAGFYLRDLVSLFGLESFTSANDAFCLQPIDVWVRRFAKHVDIVSADSSDRQIQDAIVDLCQINDCSPLSLNQGIWYAATHSFELLIEAYSI